MDPSSCSRGRMRLSAGRSVPQEMPPLAAAAHAAFVLWASSLDPDADPFVASPGGSEVRHHFSDSEASFNDSDAPPPRLHLVVARRSCDHGGSAAAARAGVASWGMRVVPRVPRLRLSGALRPSSSTPRACRWSWTRRGSGRCRAVGAGGASLGAVQPCGEVLQLQGRWSPGA